MNTYTLTFTDNDTVQIEAYGFQIKDGVLRFSTRQPDRYDHFFPIANLFEWSIAGG